MQIVTELQRGRENWLLAGGVEGRREEEGREMRGEGEGGVIAESFPRLTR